MDERIEMSGLMVNSRMKAETLESSLIFLSKLSMSLARDSRSLDDFLSAAR
jgi:hypothetical protein